MFGGSNLAGDMQTYSYFLVRNQGEYFIAKVRGDNVIFTVNGTEMTRLPKSKLHTDGFYGFRIAHNLDVDVDQVKR